jgi:hypothetical protein
MFEYKGEYYTELQLSESFNIIRDGNEWKKGGTIITD